LEESVVEGSGLLVLAPETGPARGFSSRGGWELVANRGEVGQERFGEWGGAEDEVGADVEEEWGEGVLGWGVGEVGLEALPAGEGGIGEAVFGGLAGVGTGELVPDAVGVIRVAGVGQSNAEVVGGGRGEAWG
jgi:hypothetical protein